MKRMDKFYNETYLKLETAIQELEIETDCPIKRIEAVIHHIIQSLADLKDFVLKNDFKNMEEEIHFFKYQKPVIVSKLIYYNAIYKIETRRPYGNKRTKKYFTKELKKLKRFFENNLDFYKYYRSNNSFVDEKFFVRGKHDIRLWLDTFYFEADQQQVQGFPFFPVFGLFFSFFLVQVDITVPYGYVGFGSCFLCRRQLQWMKDSFFVFLIHLLQIADPTVIHHKAIIPVE